MRQKEACREPSSNPYLPLAVLNHKSCHQTETTSNMKSLVGPEGFRQHSNIINFAKIEQLLNPDFPFKFVHANHEGLAFPISLPIDYVFIYLFLFIQ